MFHSAIIVISEVLITKINMAIIIIQIIRNNRMDTLDQLSIIIQLMIVPAMRRPRIPRLGYFHFLKAQIIQVTALILVLDQASDRA